MIRILIADDHAVVRKGLKQILSAITDMQAIDEASNGPEALSMAGKGNYDLVLLDITMPGRSGLDVLKQLRIEKPRLPVLVLSMHPEEQYAVRTLKAGASGYLSKECASEELVAAARKVMEGGKYVSDSLAQRFASQLSQPPGSAPHELLSDREYQILRMIASGKSVTEIGNELALSVKTVSTYRARILEKTGFKNNAQLTIYCIQNGLLGS
jgi:DNA-binding NarL/FixJ family response regulator